MFFKAYTHAHTQMYKHDNIHFILKISWHFLETIGHLVKSLSYTHWIERNQNISMYTEFVIFYKFVFVPLFISVFLLH